LSKRYVSLNEVDIQSLVHRCSYGGFLMKYVVQNICLTEDLEMKTINKC